ncbi:hypothetical protein CLCR_05295 [Cladophialophora carrionii]|uniref:Uncharacterized protein n=1 Tax=Cladophialophora carrionii TaxID=86049 RepID=A0A1C1CLK7_9EURO|nr:hypothetical protein CLCR_05295 [Cladophialophora carrionii]
MHMKGVEKFGLINHKVRMSLGNNAVLDTNYIEAETPSREVVKLDTCGRAPASGLQDIVEEEIRIRAQRQHLGASGTNFHGGPDKNRL